METAADYQTWLIALLEKLEGKTMAFSADAHMEAIEPRKKMTILIRLFRVQAWLRNTNMMSPTEIKRSKCWAKLQHRSELQYEKKDRTRRAGNEERPACSHLPAHSSFSAHRNRKRSFGKRGRKLYSVGH